MHGKLPLSLENLQNGFRSSGRMNMEMRKDVAPNEREISERWRNAAEATAPLTFTPDWWHERMLTWATTDPDFRIKLLRFVDVLPSLHSAGAVADHVKQYFRGEDRTPIRVAAGIAAQSPFRPLLSRVVRESVMSMSRRFIAGEDAENALANLEAIAKKGIAFTIDVLGEATLSDVEADAYLERYLSLIRYLSEQRTRLSPEGTVWDGVPPVNLSIKLSALTSHLEPAAPREVSEAVRGRLRPLLREARRYGAFIYVDMEQYRYKDLVHQTFTDVLLEPEFADWPDVGIVVQAYLRDAEEDIERLRVLSLGRGTQFSVRLVKGAYWDEERIVAAQNGWNVPVFEAKNETDRSFERCAERLLEAWPHLRLAAGTHNPASAAHVAATAAWLGVPNDAIEFQMLYGMAEGLRDAIAEDGYRTRVYVPIGEIIPGMAYLVRRLLENTSNQAWFNAVQNGATPQLPSTTPESRPKSDGFTNSPPSPLFEPAEREHLAAAIAKLRDDSGQTYPLLLAGRAEYDRPAADIRYPADPSVVIGRMAQATAADVETAVAAAIRAFPDWRDLPATERTGILMRAADLMEKRRYDLAALEIFESAKPWAEADADVAEAIDHLRYYAGQGEAMATPKLLIDLPGEHNFYFHEGRGVAAIISPWNFPLAIIAGMASAALAGGNCAILKPAAPSPIIAYKLAEILHEASVPREVAQFLPGPGREVGHTLVEHLGVDIIAFTGSSEVGLSIIEAAAKVKPGQRNVKRVVAEMGGKNAIIIDEDADIDQAVAGMLTSAFGYAGQKCSACSRLVIVGTAYDAVVERLRWAVESLVVGPPHEPYAFVPPVIGGDAHKKIEGYIEQGRRYATLLAQAKAPDSDGHYVPPSVFTDVPLNSPLAREEIFGPVLSVFRAQNFEEALLMALDSDYALTGGVYSRNPHNIESARRRFRVGNLYVNRKITGAVVGRQPFGGLAMSGVGEKAGGPDYARQFMQPRVVTENTMRRGVAPDF